MSDFAIYGGAPGGGTSWSAALEHIKVCVERTIRARDLALEGALLRVFHFVRGADAFDRVARVSRQTGAPLNDEEITVDGEPVWRLTWVEVEPLRWELTTDWLVDLERFGRPPPPWTAPAPN